MMGALCKCSSGVYLTLRVPGSVFSMHKEPGVTQYGRGTPTYAVAMSLYQISDSVCMMLKCVIFRGELDLMKRIEGL